MLLVLLLINFTCLANPFDQLDSYYVELNKKISNNPNSVLQELLNTGPLNDKPFLKAQYHYTLSQAYLNLVYPKKALEHIDLALGFIDSKNYIWFFHKINISKSQALDILNQANEGLPLIKSAINWAENNQDQELLIDALLALGYLQNTLGKYIDALDSFMQAYKLAPFSGNGLTKGAIAGSIALVYEYRREDQLSIPFFQESVEYQRSVDNQLELSISLYGLGRANKNIGLKELGKRQLEESLEISREIKDDQGVAYALKELAPLEIRAKRLKSAEQMLVEASEIFQKSQNPATISDSLATLSEVYIAMQNITQAQKVFGKAKSYINPETMPVQFVKSRELEARLLSLHGEHQKAYELLAKTFILKQKLLSKQSTKQLHELRTRYELESKAKENLMLSQVNEQQKFSLYKQNQRNQILWYGIIASSIVVFLLILLVYRSQQQRKALHKLANTDSLTGLPNRHHIIIRLEQLQQQLPQHGKIFVCMLDLDYFKRINDQFGHETGDKVLKVFGKLCREHLQKPDITGRLGGEEFLIIMNQETIQTAFTILDDLRNKMPEIAQQLNIAEEFIGFSAGISTCHKNDDLESQLKKADQALYKAKAKGRNQIIVVET